MERRVPIEQALGDLPLMLTVEQTYQVLRIGRSLADSQVRRYVASGGREGIPAVRIGSTLRVPRTALVELLLNVGPPAIAEPRALHAVDADPPVDLPSKRSTRSPRRAASALRRTTTSVAQLPTAAPD